MRGPSHPECVAAVQAAGRLLEVLGHDVTDSAMPALDDPLLSGLAASRLPASERIVRPAVAGRPRTRAPPPASSTSRCWRSIPGCSRLIEAAREADVPVIHLQYVYRQDYKDAGERLRGQEIALQRLHATELETVLSSLRAENLVICRITAHFCVEPTARDAHMRDYRVVIAGDAAEEANEEITRSWNVCEQV
ncbi:isochorismatase family protein [Actinomadura rudentiformis]|uniref:Cysteine hydrolase n=1 Tax=Actinomadura rudentiformis TaxID=359158 RepID=A0A6H9Z2U5_9ACTN|nr:isochorismatase family protein [Actinomadura rudentiformis]KAB2352372.1 cysteine hydrolase [Actinomadura rudentiformis]